MSVAQLCLTLRNPMDCSPPGSSVHGILQTRILEWVAIPFSRGSSHPKDRNWVPCIAGGFLTIWATREDWNIRPKSKWFLNYIAQRDSFNSRSIWIQTLFSWKEVCTFSKLNLISVGSNNGFAYVENLQNVIRVPKSPFMCSLVIATFNILLYFLPVMIFLDN